ncbi:hypothetical protein CANCADRAFT_105124 [Tortispora caseinolytica NRRL Y-17796]|uniref:Uncharacterized protein n=1 Tax=Tortispora caseinolytica NRRL Y-17796 TaxID=767744 RepID=A0A1E4TF41_9ASCO|nr:hypothetical protein CANCADRAFT_105124 [Tortispora caseinolytica NRRL Y-17796]
MAVLKHVRLAFVRAFRKSRRRKLVVVVTITLLGLYWFFGISTRTPSKYLIDAYYSIRQKADPFDGSQYREAEYWREPLQYSWNMDLPRIVIPPIEEHTAIAVYYDTDDEYATESLVNLWKLHGNSLGFKPILVSSSDLKSFRSCPEITPDVSHYMTSQYVCAMAYAGTHSVMSLRTFFINVGSEKLDLISPVQYIKNFDRDFTDAQLFDESDPMGEERNAEDHENPLHDAQKLSRFEKIGDAESFVLLGSSILAYMYLHGLQKAASSKDFDSETYITSINDLVDTSQLAVYDNSIISTRYKTINSETLPDLINSHLHSVFLEKIEGIEVLAPVTDKKSVLAIPAFNLAERLARCPGDAFAEEYMCPPNMSGTGKCLKCSPSLSLTITSIPSFSEARKNSFVVGNIPHPLIYGYLQNGKAPSVDDVLDMPRNELTRVISEGFHPPAPDNHLNDSTTSHWSIAGMPPIGTGTGGRLTYLKAHIYDQLQNHTGLWLDGHDNDDDNYYICNTLGFRLGTHFSEHRYSKDEIIYNNALKVFQNPEMHAVKRSIEKWSAADTELWKFLTAIRHRSTMEWRHADE